MRPVRTAHRSFIAEVRVVLVMPYEGIRHGLTLLLEGMRGLQVVAQSSSASEGVDLVRHYVPDVVILDAEPERTVRTIAEVRNASPTSRLLVTVDDFTRAHVEDRFGADIADHMIHAVYPGELLPTIRDLLRERKRAQE
jgi:DNA-binding NarL/FixJ family response regulator